MTKFVVAAFAAFLLMAAPAGAAVYTVTTTADTGGACPPNPRLPQCPLRVALANAANNSDAADTINLAAGAYQVTGGELLMPGGTSIIGAGADLTSVDAHGTSRVFRVSGASNRIVGVTIKGGSALNEQDGGYGGNIIVPSGGLTLDHARVTGGVALHGGGLATDGGGGGALAILNSLIDNNEARTGATPAQSGDGGGLLLRGQDNAVTMTMRDSTVAGNRARIAAGVYVTAIASTAATLERVTIADNVATVGAGGMFVITGSATVQGSIFARNQAPSLPNCAFQAGRVTIGSGNIESGTDCGFTTGRQNTTAGLAATLSMDGGFTPVYTIPYNSLAHDFAGSCKGTDQRDVTRPVDGGCDAGAYEALFAPPEAAISAGPPFTFSSAESGTTYECSLDGAPFVACASPYDPSAAAGAHTLAVRATDRRGNVGNVATTTFTVAPPIVVAQPTPTPIPPPPPPTPVVNKTVVLKAVTGTILVKLPGAKTFTPLDPSKGIPVGTIVDTRKGTVELTSIPKAGAPPETAKFWDGIFKISQSNGITTLSLVETLAPCPKKKASSAASKPKTRKLWGDGKGKFRTQGKYSAATVRGTKWLVQDSCAGTLTRVANGVVNVRDDVKHKTIVLRAPKSYTARPKR